MNKSCKDCRRRRCCKDNNGVKYLLVGQDLFDRTVDAKGNENKRFQGNGSFIFDYDYKKTIVPKNLG